MAKKKHFFFKETCNSKVNIFICTSCIALIITSNGQFSLSNDIIIIIFQQLNNNSTVLFNM